MMGHYSSVKYDGGDGDRDGGGDGGGDGDGGEDGDGDGGGDRDGGGDGDGDGDGGGDGDGDARGGGDGGGDGDGRGGGDGHGGGDAWATSLRLSMLMWPMSADDLDGLSTWGLKNVGWLEEMKTGCDHEIHFKTHKNKTPPNNNNTNNNNIYIRSTGVILFSKVWLAIIAVICKLIHNWCWIYTSDV